MSIGGGGSIAPSGAPGTARYLGTELDLGLTWSYAPGLTFDLAGGYMWAGGALATSAVVLPGPISAPNRSPKNVQTIAARVRFTF